MDALLQDLRYAARQLRKSPLFSLVVVATLALGIGANAAIFSLMDQVVFRPLPVHEPDRLVLFDTPGPGSGSFHSNYDLTPVTLGFYSRLAEQSGVLANAAAYFAAPLNLAVGAETERVSGALVSGSFFDTLGLRPASGRLLGPQDDVTPGAHPVVVLSHGYWSRRFAAEAGIVGRELRINGVAMTVVGVGARPCLSGTGWKRRASTGSPPSRVSGMASAWSARGRAST